MTCLLQLNVSLMPPSSRSRLHLNSMKKIYRTWIIWTGGGKEIVAQEAMLGIIKRQKKKILSAIMERAVALLNPALFRNNQRFTRNSFQHKIQEQFKEISKRCTYTQKKLILFLQYINILKTKYLKTYSTIQYLNLEVIFTIVTEHKYR